MARAKRTWAEKLADAEAKPGLPKKWFCKDAGKTLVIAHPREIEAIIRGVGRGRTITMQQMCEQIAKAHRADMACPMTTGILAWLIAHAADEAEQAGGKRVAPWWRVLKTGGELNPKYPGGGATQRERLEAEGHTIVAKGKKLKVADAAPATKGIARKVIAHARFGACVLLPKTVWAKLPAKGGATVSIDGRPRRVTVRSERCDCQGTGEHEHRFLSFGKSGGPALGGRVTLAVGG